MKLLVVEVGIDVTEATAKNIMKKGLAFESGAIENAGLEVAGKKGIIMNAYLTHISHKVVMKFNEDVKEKL